MSDAELRDLAIKHCDSLSGKYQRVEFNFDGHGLRAFATAVERAARAAAFDEAIAAIKALPMGFADTIGPVMCIAVIEELRARAEGQSNG